MHDRGCNSHLDVSVLHRLMYISKLKPMTGDVLWRLIASLCNCRFRLFIGLVGVSHLMCLTLFQVMHKILYIGVFNLTQMLVQWLLSY